MSRVSKASPKAAPKKTSRKRAAKKAPKAAPKKRGRPSKKEVVTTNLVQARADFVRFYIEQDFREPAKAYLRAFPDVTVGSANTLASRLLREVEIQASLAAELEALLAEKRLPLEKRIFETYFIRAFYDPTEIIDLNGKLKITEAQLRKRGLQVCIDSINKRLNAKGDSYLEYKLADRDKALDVLRQYVQMIELSKLRLLPHGDDNPNGDQLSSDVRARMQRAFEEVAGSTLRRTKVSVEVEEFGTRDQRPMRKVGEEES